MNWASWLNVNKTVQFKCHRYEQNISIKIAVFFSFNKAECHANPKAQIYLNYLNKKHKIKVWL